MYKMIPVLISMRCFLFGFNGGPIAQDAAHTQNPPWGNQDWEYEKIDDLRTLKGRFDIQNPGTMSDSPAISCCGEEQLKFPAMIGLDHSNNIDVVDQHNHRIQKYKL